MVTAVDTTILLDILIPDEAHMESSKHLLEEGLQGGRLIICEIVYAELASQFPSVSELDMFLAETGITLVSSSVRALSLAGERWAHYARTRGKGMVCPGCGKKSEPSCPQCGSALSARQRVLSDFIIGAHALSHADLLVSRDRGIYTTHFKDLTLKKA
ncbi:MAG: type II toxin-antitoxin system VapC family toxin [Alphaproteobacteria bacterium]|uniref:Type II toxin-antitoxin system VapC family toxin n=1 Tax=Candidatus Nitrobium versatile TaxID=2884831 RepID=A0A953J677_9BACT|nr:type II toxin-antitoxin system VapC family toxin [Candidatus Nitrobium versatile]